MSTEGFATTTEDMSLQLESTIERWKGMIEHSIVSSSQHLVSSFDSITDCDTCTKNLIIDILIRLFCETKEPNRPDQQKIMCTKIKKYIVRFIKATSTTIMETPQGSEVTLKLMKNLLQSSHHVTSGHIDPSLLHCLGQVEDLLLHHHMLVSSSYNQEDRYSKDFVEEQVIGKGGFGVVVRAQHRLDRCRYAVKKIVIHKKKLATMLMREAQALAALDHPNIVRYYSAWLQPHHHSSTPGDCLNSDVGNSQSNITSISSSGKVIDIVDCSDETFSSQSNEVNNISKSDDDQDNDFVIFEHGLTKSGQTSGNNNNENSIISNDNEDNETDSSHDQNSGIVVPFMLSNNINPSLKQTLFIQMSLCGISLKKFLRSRNDKCPSNPKDLWTVVNPARCVQFFFDILLALHYIHEKGVLHRDIKPGNILLSMNEERALLSDFGLVSHVKINVPNNYGNARVGTPPYTAPEVENGMYDKKSDLYGLGIILYELFHPFKTESERACEICELKKGCINPEIKNRWPEMASVVMSLTNNDYRKRPTAAEVLHAIQHVLEAHNSKVSLFPVHSNEIFASSDNISELSSNSRVLLDIPGEIQELCNLSCNFKAATINSSDIECLHQSSFVSSYTDLLNSEENMCNLEKRKQLLEKELEDVAKKLSTKQNIS